MHSMSSGAALHCLKLLTPTPEIMTTLKILGFLKLVTNSSGVLHIYTQTA